MTSISKISDRYLRIQTRIAETKATLATLRKEEKNLNTELKKYLQETGEDGIRIDQDTIINLKDFDKKIVVPPTKYKEKLKQLLVKKGIYSLGLEEEIIGAKVDGQIQEQKLKIVKKKGNKR